MPRLRRRMVNRFGIKIITIAILVLKISMKKAKTIAICAAQHEGAKILFTNKIDCHSTFSIRVIQRVNDLPRGGKLLDFFIKKRRDYPHCANIAIGIVLTKDMKSR